MSSRRLRLQRAAAPGRGSRRRRSGPASSSPPSIAARSRMPDEPVAAAVPRGRGRAAAVVEHAPARPRPRPYRSVTVGVRRVRVPERVRERLLHDAVGRQVDARRQRALRPLAAHVDPQARVPQQAPSARRGCRAPAGDVPAPPPSRPHRCEQPAQLPLRVPRRRLDRAQRRPRLVGPVLEHVDPPRRPGRRSPTRCARSRRAAPRAIRGSLLRHRPARRLVRWPCAGCAPPLRAPRRRRRALFSPLRMSSGVSSAGEPTTASASASASAAGG